MRKINFNNKVENSGSTSTGRVFASDINEIKEVVNENSDLTSIAITNLQNTDSTLQNEIIIVDEKISASQGNLLGGIAFDAIAPTPGVNGRYIFTSSGSCTWITDGATIVAINDEVLVTYTASSTYVYTYLQVAGNYIPKTDVKQVLGTSETNVVSQNVVNRIVGNQFTIIGQILNSAGGFLINETAKRTDYLMIDPAKNITLRGYDNAGVSISLCYFYDLNYVPISGYTTGSVGEKTVTIPAGDVPINAVYIIVSADVADHAAFIIGVNTCSLLGKSLREKLSISQLKTTITEEVTGSPLDATAAKLLVAKSIGKNLFNPNDTGVQLGHYINYTNGNAMANAGYNATGFIPVVAGQTYTMSYIYMIAYYNAAKAYISGIETATKTQTAPAGAAYIRCTIDTAAWDSFQFEHGTLVTYYERYTELSGMPIEPTPEIILPDKIYAVVGDTLQLFKRGFVKAVNPYNYDVFISCIKGGQFPRYWEYTPALGDVGTTPFVAYIKNGNGDILTIKEVSLITVAAVQSPSAATTILCVGDSLTTSGEWCQEASRRLIGTGGSPAGLALSNILFKGRKTGGGIGWEGNGGWQWSSYATAGVSAYRFTVSGITTPPALGAVYANNGEYFTVMEINITLGSGSILCTNYYGNAPEASGTLTKDSGLGDATITFSASALDSGNPFWDAMAGALDFPTYVNTYMSGACDSIYFLLTWNGQAGNKSDFSYEIGVAKTLIDHIHTNYPSCKIKIMGIPLPSLNGGIGIDYQGSSSYSNPYGLVVTALNLNNAYQNWCNEAAYSGFMEFVNISAQFDAENNMQEAEKPVNTRSSKTEMVGINGVHPDIEGQNQIADVVYRNFIANFCQ